MKKALFIVFIIFYCGTYFNALAQKATKSPHGKLKIECEQCHVTADWKIQESKLKFDHQSTHFPLVGVHKNVECRRCHATLFFSITPNQCSNCHLDIHRNEFGKYCNKCHSVNSWEDRKSLVDMHKRGEFSLTGLHARIDCDACHQNQNWEDYGKTSVRCSSCHKENYQQSENPNHLQAGFSDKCESCHAPEAGNWRIASFKHVEMTLSKKAHAKADCKDCHVSQYHNLSQDCNQCHQADYAHAKEPDHAASGFLVECLLCHRDDSWQGAKFDHNTASVFKLTNSHTTTKCIDCHKKDQNPQETPMECFACHEQNYENTVSLNHVANQIGHQCQNCHSTDAWDPPKFNHNNTNFQLVGAHRKVQCLDCHTSGYHTQSTQCYDCHRENYANVKSLDHVKNNFPHDCKACHSEIAWKPANFDHENTMFQLTGSHTAVSCRGCHQDNYEKKLKTNCNFCHVQDFNATTDPNHTANRFSKNCKSCHTTNGWSPVVFDHNDTFFPLVNAHQNVDCIQCHTDGYKNANRDCYSCHENDYRQSAQPGHLAANFPTECNICHQATKWSDIHFNHKTTKFPLSNAHQNVQCIDCHSSALRYLEGNCSVCHSSDFENAADPSHVQNGFDRHCLTCHFANSWSPAKFDHARTTFQLAGSHKNTDCANCHKKSYNIPLSGDCFSCHEQDFSEADNPNHTTNNFSHQCEDCHNTSAFSPSTFDHNQTQFQLVGAHVTTQCIDCHGQGYQSLATDCFSCHEQDFSEADNPNHTTNNFSHQCEDCHNTSAFSPATFSHDNTGFSLVGAHQRLDCIECHSSGYRNMSTDCYSCHNNDFDATNDPDHRQANFSHNCTQCHSMNDWTPATFDHNSTGFQLTGGHRNVDCVDCHASGYNNTSAQCYSCHRSNYNNVHDPNHQSNNFSHDCTQCHSINGWTPATFDHNSTGFQLTGGHRALACIDCHSSGYSNTSAQCYSCHRSDYNGVSNPDHQQNNFSHNCNDCHSTNGWTPATFDHNNTGFNLTGAHRNASCLDCHASGYSGTSKECYSCHRQNYNNTRNPNHQAANFPTTCQNCHNTNRWDDANWNHDGQYFPIYSGEHKNEWNSCSDCHVNSGNYHDFECIYCHKHEKAKMDEEHRNESGYQYNSQKCYQCHPKGK